MPYIVAPVTEMNCSFDEDLCGWRQPQNIDYFNWIRKNGPTPSHGTGPASDHTTGNCKLK